MTVVAKDRHEAGLTGIAGGSRKAEARHIQGGILMLILTRKQNESIRIGDDINVVIVDIRGETVRIGVEAPRDLPVHRSEVYDAIHATDGPTMSREFVPNSRPIGDAAHFVREGQAALKLSCGYPSGSDAALAGLSLALDKLRKALAILTNREPPVVHPGGRND